MGLKPLARIVPRARRQERRVQHVKRMTVAAKAEQPSLIFIFNGTELLRVGGV
jgi:hypothetical protein